MNDEFADPRVARCRRRRRRMVVSGVLAAAAAGWIFRPHLHADESLVEPRLRTLVKPYQLVNSDTIFDGGSVRMEITDATGHREYFFVSCNDGWKKVYVMINSNSLEGSFAASNHGATLQELAAILSDHCRDCDDYGNLEKMTRRLGDRIKAKVYYEAERFKWWWQDLNL